VVVWREAATVYHLGVAAGGGPVRRRGGELAMPDGNAAFGGLTCALGRDGRLWYGIDTGEWGGGAGSVDLATGASALVAGVGVNVFGFHARPDGAWWAHGGLTSSYVAALGAGDRRVLYQREGTADWAIRSHPEVLPWGVPITQILDDGEGLLVAMLDEIYRVDPGLGDWQLVARLHCPDGPTKPPSRWRRRMVMFQ
jgi:hypothetical protein